MVRRRGAHRLVGHLLLYSPLDPGLFPGKFLADSGYGGVFLSRLLGLRDTGNVGGILV